MKTEENTCTETATNETNSVYSAEYYAESKQEMTLNTLTTSQKTLPPSPET